MINISEKGPDKKKTTDQRTAMIEKTEGHLKEWGEFNKKLNTFIDKRDRWRSILDNLKKYMEEGKVTKMPKTDQEFKELAEWTEKYKKFSKRIETLNNILSELSGKITKANEEMDQIQPEIEGLLESLDTESDIELKDRYLKANDDLEEMHSKMNELVMEFVSTKDVRRKDELRKEVENLGEEETKKMKEIVEMWPEFEKRGISRSRYSKAA